MTQVPNSTPEECIFYSHLCHRVEFGTCVIVLYVHRRWEYGHHNPDTLIQQLIWVNRETEGSSAEVRLLISFNCLAYRSVDVIGRNSMRGSNNTRGKHVAHFGAGGILITIRRWIFTRRYRMSTMKLVDTMFPYDTRGKRIAHPEHGTISCLQ